jgi:hypothetical protein
MVDVLIKVDHKKAHWNLKIKSYYFFTVLFSDSDITQFIENPYDFETSN